MTSRRLPPLNSLRAFEAAARHVSFTRAADELAVTQAAVSHQVRGLEDWLQTKLFRRKTRKLELTRAGQRLLPSVTTALDSLASTIEEIAPRQDGRGLRVSLTPSFTSKWLVHRLGKFWQQHPEIDVSLESTMQVVDLLGGEADLAVRWGAGRWDGLESELLLGSSVVPVCSPKLLEAGPPLEKPEDLANHVLLAEGDYDEWSHWLRAAGVEGVDPTRARRVNDAVVLLDIAAAGEGVALGRVALIEEDLKHGRLVAPFEKAWEQEQGFFVVYPPGALKDERIKAFRDFLFAECCGVGGDAAA
jgi:LysR family glycine cleavage system transcriptional activator